MFHTKVPKSYVNYNHRDVPEGTGWILDNFPKTLKQAKALERALSGFVSTDSRASLLSTPAGGPLNHFLRKISFFAKYYHMFELPINKEF